MDRKNKDELEIEKIRAEITHLLALTAKASKEAQWYEITLAIAGTLALVAIAKLFL